MRFALAAALSASALAGPLVATIPEAGPHYRIVTVRKSVHPRNDLVVFTRLDENCREVREHGAPVLDFYWLMDRRSYKPVNPLLKRGIRKRLALDDAAGGNAFTVRLNELKEVDHDLGPNPSLRVRSGGKPGACFAEARMTLGPSNKNAEIRLEEIYSEAELKGHFSAKVKLVALTGTDVKTGKKVVRVYRAK